MSTGSVMAISMSGNQWVTPRSLVELRDAWLMARSDADAGMDDREGSPPIIPQAEPASLGGQRHSWASLRTKAQSVEPQIHLSERIGLPLLDRALIKDGGLICELSRSAFGEFRRLSQIPVRPAKVQRGTRVAVRMRRWWPERWSENNSARSRALRAIGPTTAMSSSPSAGGTRPACESGQRLASTP